VFDLVGRDGDKVRALWNEVDKGGAFDLASTSLSERAAFARVPEFGFQSGASSHAKRMETIRQTWETYGVMIDTHTADGLKVALEQREAGVPMLVLETALPAKFEDSIREALGQDPVRPTGMEALESLPQRFEVMEADADAIKQYIVAKTA
jgi:threonine synthase